MRIFGKLGLDFGRRIGNVWAGDPIMWFRVYGLGFGVGSVVGICNLDPNDGGIINRSDGGT